MLRLAGVRVCPGPGAVLHSSAIIYLYGSAQRSASHARNALGQQEHPFLGTDCIVMAVLYSTPIYIPGNLVY